MSETQYKRVVSEIEALDLADQLRLLEQMAGIIRKKTGISRNRSILDLKGKGKEIWKNIDVKTYLDEERSSWNG